MKPAKERIKDAFISFLRDQPYDRIKVSELIRAADINRSTFYRHYENVTAVYNELCEETANEYISALPPFSREGDAYRFVVRMYSRARQSENRELVMLLLGERCIILLRWTAALSSDAWSFCTPYVGNSGWDRRFYRVNITYSQILCPMFVYSYNSKYVVAVV